MRNLIIITILLATLSAIAADLTPTTLDITKPLDNLPGVTTRSTPEEITAAIQARFNYLNVKSLKGRVYLPAGEWPICRPLFMIDDNKELVGDSIGKTILRAADGYRAMPMVNMCFRSYQNERPLQTVNRQRLDGILDDTVTGERFGVRTYTEYPSTNFPQQSHINVPAPKKASDWSDGAAYQVNDIVLLHPLNAQRGVDAVCILAHTASKDNKPYTGKDWRQYWVLRLPFNMQFVGDPLAAGAYNPATKRATDWEGTKQFTLDFAFVINADPAIYKEQWRPLCGVFTQNAWRAENRIWMVALRQNGTLEFDLTLADGTSKSFVVADCKAAGLYRLAVQVDFAAQTVQAWTRKPGEPDFTRTIQDAMLPAGAGFKTLEYGYCGIAMGESGNPPCDNGNNEPPTDITVCGLHTSATLRYADTPILQQRKTEAATDDNFRYFINDPGTLAFLPLTDNPAEAEMDSAGPLITVQHGSASGDAKQKGYGFLNVPSSTCAIPAHRISDMTIAPGPIWGAGVLTWNLIDSKLWNLDIRGGYYAIGDLFKGAEYTMDIRDCLLSGSEAAINGMSNIIYVRNVTINPVGRYGLLMSGSNCVLDNIKFVDPQTYQSESYFRHIFTTIYGGMNSLAHISAEAPAGCRFPSKAAFSMQTIWIFRTSMIMTDCKVANMGPEAAFLNLDFENSAGHGIIALNKCAYTGSPIASFIRTDSPWWSGPVNDFIPNTPVRKLVDLRTPPFAKWEEKKTYQPEAFVALNNQAYKCLAAHTAEAANQPGADGGKFWLPVSSNFIITPAKR